MEMRIVVDINNKTADLGDLYGVFFEDINHAADGGLYAELVRNRSFEFNTIDKDGYHALTAWNVQIPDGAIGSISVQDSHPYCLENPHYLVIDATEPAVGIGVVNEGFGEGIYIEAGKRYIFSCYAACDGRPLRFEVSLRSADGTMYEKKVFLISNSEWECFRAEFVSPVTNTSARLGLRLVSAGRIYIDMVSLFPEDTFLNRQNGLRKDIAEMIADLHPKFMRFPGGCLVHDGSLNENDRDSMYRWKKTLGPIEKRPARRNNWGYNQTLGLGYFEFFQFCEDIGAKPLPVLPGGWDPHHKRAVPVSMIKEWIDDALDLIEFANGDIDTEWGKKRADLGHPEPFFLEYIGIGNEEVGEEFFERYTYFHEAIRKKYPEIKIINTAGPCAGGIAYEMGWESAEKHGSDLIDEHYYQAPEWFIANHHHYDNYNGRTTKVFLGEYASKDDTWYNALVEASYMIGLEKNAEAVGLACYAPLLCHTDYINWKPDMILYDNNRVFGTPSYYVQKLFMHNQGEQELTVSINTDIENEVIESKLGKKIYLAPGIRDRDCVMECSDIRILTKEGEITCPNAVIRAEDEPLFLGEADEDYTVRFVMKRTSGIFGISLRFACADKNNFRKIELGGWENQTCSFEEEIGGRGSFLYDAGFEIQTGKHYQVEVNVKQGRITVYVDGNTVIDSECLSVTIEPIYCCASFDNSTRDIIVKAVNLKNEAYMTEIELKDTGIEKAEVYHMDGYALDERNSFEEPRRVIPKTDSVPVIDGKIRYMMPARSINIFRVKSM